MALWVCRSDLKQFMLLGNDQGACGIEVATPERVDGFGGRIHDEDIVLAERERRTPGMLLDDRVARTLVLIIEKGLRPPNKRALNKR